MDDASLMSGEDAGGGGNSSSAEQLLIDDLRQKIDSILPPSWEQKYDENGTSYFENNVSGVSTWEVPSPEAPQTDDAQVATLQRELKRMKKQQKKSDDQARKISLKEAAMKSDINKMKSEVKQAKREANDSQKQAALEVLAAKEEICRAYMQGEDNLLNVVVEHTYMIPGIVKSLRRRDLEATQEFMKGFRLLEQQQVASVVIECVNEAIKEFDDHTELVAQLRFKIKDLEEALSFEKLERARENREWEALVHKKNEEITHLEGLIAERDAHISELNQYIEETATQHQLELERARQHDENTIASLEAQLELSKTTHEEYMHELARVWPDGIPPPSVLRKYVIPIRQQEAAERQLKAQEEIRIGSHVQAWAEEAAAYFEATVTALKDGYVEVRWNEGSEEPPGWVSAEYCYAVVPEDKFKLLEQGTQTTIAYYDEAMMRVDPIRPLSARGRMDGGMEEIDKRAIVALRERARIEIAKQTKTEVNVNAAKLFKLIDEKTQGEVEVTQVWEAIAHKQSIHEFLQDKPELEALKRKEYLYLGWKKVDLDGDISMPFALDEFQQVCAEALLLSRRDMQTRELDPIDSLQTIEREVLAAAAMKESSSDEDEEANAKVYVQATSTNKVLEKLRNDKNTKGTLVVPWLSDSQQEADQQWETLVNQRAEFIRHLELQHQDEFNTILMLRTDAEEALSKANAAVSTMSSARAKLQSDIKVSTESSLQRFKQLDEIGSKNSGLLVSDDRILFNTQQNNVFHPEMENFSDAGTQQQQKQQEQLDWKMLSTKLSDHVTQITAKIEANRKELDALSATETQIVSAIENMGTKYSMLQAELAQMNETQVEPGSQKLTQTKEKLSKLELEMDKKHGEVKSIGEQHQSISSINKELRAAISDVLTPGLAEMEKLRKAIKSKQTQLDGIDQEKAQHQQASECERQALEYWTGEKESIGKQWHEQQELLGAMQSIFEKFEQERTYISESLLKLVEHREVLQARLLDAKVRKENANNELEQSIAGGHLELVRHEVEEGMNWNRARWQDEMSVRDRLLTECKRQLEQDCIQIQAALKTRMERRKLRHLLAEELSATQTKNVDQATRAERIKELRMLAQERESSWHADHLQTMTVVASNWIGEQEKQRYVKQIELLTRESVQTRKHCEEIRCKSEKAVAVAQDKLEALQVRFDAQDATYVEELEVLTKTSEESVKLLHSQVKEVSERLIEHDRFNYERIECLENDFLAKQIQLEGTIRQLTDTLKQNRHWIDMLLEESKQLKTDFADLKQTYEHERRVHAREIDDLRSALQAMTSHAERLDMWIESLKEEVRLLNEKVTLDEQTAERVRLQHEQIVRGLRFETWKRDETARTLGTNIDFCFGHFAETLARLAGASKEFNERIAANAGIQVLICLLDSSRVDIRRNALKALSSAAWDGHVDVRTLRHRAESDWKKWVSSVSVVVALRWYRQQNGKMGEEESKEEESPFSPIMPGMTVCHKNNTVQVVEPSVAEGDCGPNLPNQKRIGRGLHGYNTGVANLVDLLDSADPATVETAAGTLAVLALEVESRERIGQVPGVMSKFIGLLGLTKYQHTLEDDDGPESTSTPTEENQQVMSIPNPCGNNVEREEIQRHVLSTIANLLFENETNQQLFYKIDGVKPLVELCSQSKDVDVLDSATAVLANATSLHTGNSHRIGQVGGIPVLVGLCDSSFGRERLDRIGERIQGNAVQALVNATRDCTSENAELIGEFGVGPLVQLCISESDYVLHNAASIIGNIAQNDVIRSKLGSEGAVEAMFTLCDRKPILVKADALLALTNLAWNASNQDRIGKQLPQLIRLCLDEEPEIRVNATSCLANSLFYHEGNRRRFGLYTKCTPAMITLLCDDAQPVKVHENVARALGTAAYNDAVALQAGILGVIPPLIRLAGEPGTGRQRCAAFALGNLAVHDSMKANIISNNGIEAMTALCGSDCTDTVRYANKVLEVLADMSRAGEVLARREKFGVQGLLELILGEEQGAKKYQKKEANVQALACDEISSIVCNAPQKRDQVLKYRGHNICVRVLKDSLSSQENNNDPLQRKLQQRLIWTLRSLVDGGVRYQEIGGAAGVIEVLIAAIREHYPRSLPEMENELIMHGSEDMAVNLVHSRDVTEAALATLFVLVSDNERNCRRTLQLGLNILVKIADDNNQSSEEDNKRGQRRQDCDVHSSPIGELALHILQVMGPYSWIKCSNCKSKQQGGTCCSGCGHKLVNQFSE